MTKNISLTIDDELIDYVDELAEINGRSRSSMISWLILQSKRADEALEKEAEDYEKKSM